jgi:hypothetical protein
MTREEQIREAAWKASMTEETIIRQEVIKDGVHVGYDNVLLRDSERPIARLFFREGVKWADANQPSPWISVEDKLPDRLPAKFANWSKEVFVAVKRGRDYRAYVDKYSHIYKTWGVFGDEVTHWMPIPELPKEE